LFTHCFTVNIGFKINFLKDNYEVFP